MLTASLADLIREQGGEILTDTTITSVDAAQKTVTDSEQRVYSYDQLVWAADLKRLYAITDTAKLDQQIIEQIEHHRSAIEASRGGDSIFSLYLGVDLPNEYFFERSNGHLFYTPSSEDSEPLIRVSSMSCLRTSRAHRKNKSCSGSTGTAN